MRFSIKLLWPGCSCSTYKGAFIVSLHLNSDFSTGTLLVIPVQVLHVRQLYLPLNIVGNPLFNTCYDIFKKRLIKVILSPLHLAPPKIRRLMTQPNMIFALTIKFLQSNRHSINIHHWSAFWSRNLILYLIPYRSICGHYNSSKFRFKLVNETSLKYLNIYTVWPCVRLGYHEMFKISLLNSAVQRIPCRQWVNDLMCQFRFCLTIQFQRFGQMWRKRSL